MRRRLRGASRGVTLIELMVSLAIMALLATMAAPFFGNYIVNARLREAGHVLLAEAQFAQTEAVKRNGPVRLTVNGSTLQVVDRSTGTNTTVRQRSLPGGVAADANAIIEFTSQGFPAELAEATVELGTSGANCSSSDYRCPALRVEAGGGIRLCGDRNNCT